MNIISRSILVLLLSVVTLLIISSCTPPLVRFEYVSSIRAVDLGTLPSGRNSTAQDINDGGYIVGRSDTSSAGETRAFVIDAQGMKNLGTLPGGGNSEAHGISENGYIVGSAYNSVNVQHGFVARYGVMHDLGAYPPEDEIGSRSNAYAVNNTPLVVGNVDLAGVVWDVNGTPYFPPFPPTTVIKDAGGFLPAIARDINSYGQIVGSLLGDGVGFRISSGALERLRTLGIADDHAYGINNFGHVVGTSLKGPPVRYHAVLWATPSIVRDLGTLGGDNSVARDINDSGTVVGYSETDSGDTHAFIWRPGLGMRSLGTLGGRNSKAFAINSAGVIVGESETTTGEVHATRWDVTLETRIFPIEESRARPPREIPSHGSEKPSS